MNINKENIDNFLIDEKTTLYSARHTFATIFINSEGAKTSELAQMMGRSVSGIDRYIKELMSIEDVLKARDKMD
jgi:predicted transcriptional regulator